MPPPRTQRLPSQSSFLLFVQDGRDPDGDHGIEFPNVNTATAIGITVAIAGNILISLALNVQKLAHKRMEAEKLHRLKARELKGKRTAGETTNGNAGGRHVGPSLVEEEEEDEGERTPTERLENVFVQPSAGSATTPRPAIESLPLLAASDTNLPAHGYGSGSRPASSHTVPQYKIPKSQKRTLLSRFLPFQTHPKPTHSPVLLPVEVVAIKTSSQTRTNGKKENGNLLDDEDGHESDYLKSRLWWLGFFLMNLGEVGNFISYAFAPASVVAPLGTFALMANCFFAPIMLGERFRKIDLLGIFIAVIGAVTVVLSSNTSNVRLGPDALVRAVSQHVFVVYSLVYTVGAIVLAVLSEGRIGRQWVIVDVGLCALFGGFTVLSTKGVSTLLTMEWIEMFTYWITYPIILVLIFTGVCQIRYLNRALMRFDSKVVIPIQFVLFNLSAIVGSAILYGDFKRAKFHQFVTFLYGCAATFVGVFIIAWDGNGSEDSDDEADMEDSSGARDGVSDESGRDVASSPRVGMGSLGRRRRLALVMPSAARETPILRHKQSGVSLVGLSPAQHLLLVHTPPRDVPDFRFRDHDPDYDPLPTPDSSRRRRAISWFGEEHSGGRVTGNSGGRRTRDGSVGRR